ncbi:MAG: hypothetical protein KDE31_37590, partial [Caldilineaceae bacterium]|nr:hypothetical protein [Caldilineaceae bacterium]
MSRQFKFYQLFALLLLFVAITIGACSSEPSSSAEPPVSSQPSAPTLPVPTAEAVAVEEVATEPPLLLYQGPAEMGSADVSKCASLQLDHAMSATLGGCDGTTTQVALGERFSGDLGHFVEVNASFVYETATEKLLFSSNGGEAGEAWQRAILAWARARYAELSSGQTSATINTAMSWFVGQDFNQ